MSDPRRGGAGDEVRRAEWELMEFLTSETGDSLYTILTYTDASWDLIYLDASAHERFGFDADTVDRDGGGLIDAFRGEAEANRDREAALDIGVYRCTLHLFDRWILLHFSLEERGLVLGYDAGSAPTLTGFVSDCDPYVRRILLDDGGSAVDRRPASSDPVGDGPRDP